MSYAFPKTMTVKQAVISTLAYFDLFDTALTRDEIYENLFFLPPDQGKIDIYLQESPLISEYDNYFSLKRNEAFYAHFEAKRCRAKQYWKKVQHFHWLFAICPFIKLVAVCNSLPIRAVEEDSDIDLLIITDKHHLFTARFFITLLSSLAFVRRGRHLVRKRFCLSFYVTEEKLNFAEIEQKPYDIYLAYWLKTLEPTAGDYQIYEKLLLENKGWIKPYFHSLTKHRRRFRHTKPWQKKIKKFLEKSFGAEKWEIRFKNWQLKRAVQKYKGLEDKSGTVISETMLKFHDRDIREKVRHEWVKRINEFV